MWAKGYDLNMFVGFNIFQKHKKGGFFLYYTTRVHKNRITNKHKQAVGPSNHPPLPLLSLFAE